MTIKPTGLCPIHSGCMHRMHIDLTYITQQQFSNLSSVNQCYSSQASVYLHHSAETVIYSYNQCQQQYCYSNARGSTF